MTRTFTLRVAREKGRYTVHVRGAVPLEGERKRFNGKARALRLGRAVRQAFASLDPFAVAYPATDERYEHQITPRAAAMSLYLEITAGDETDRHFALRDRSSGRTVLINSTTPIQFAIPRQPL